MKKITNYRNQPQMDDLNRLHKAVQDLIDSGAQGEKGDKGDDGEHGWTPVLSLVEREDDIVVQIADYVGGTGNKPSQWVGLYVGSTGLVTDILDAVNVRGLQGLRGEAGLDGVNGVGVPAGGTTGQVLTKASDDSFETIWADVSGGASTFLELTDTPNQLGNVGQVLGIGVDFYANKRLEWRNLPPSVNSILDLSDTPSTYGQDGQVLKLTNNFGTYRLEWANLEQPVERFTGLIDTPPSYTGQAGKIVAVNASEDALEFIDAPSGGGGGGSSPTYGSFTPVLVNNNSNTPSSATITSATGTYILIGDTVTVSGQITWNNGAAINEAFRIAGLPFEVSDGYVHATVGAVANNPLPDKNVAGNTIQGVHGYLNSYFNQLWVLDNNGVLLALSTNSSSSRGLTFSATYKISQ